MNKNLKSKILIIFIFTIVSVAIYLLSFSLFENKINDSLTKILVNIQQEKVSNDVVLIVIDDKSIKRIPWPWRKELFSDMFSFLEHEAGAKSIVFQNLIVFPDTYNPNSDKIFFQSLKNYNNLINSYILLN